jgi:acetolactate synthase-1/2/3 large subunit
VTSQGAASQAGRTVADLVGRLAAQSGARVAFGHPGGEVVGVVRALEAAGIRFILARHETQAAFMAGGLGEITGRPGICVATLGPGAANMVTGVASALLERAPLIAITAATAVAAPKGTTHQVLPLEALYAPITKRTLTITGDTAPDKIADTIVHATRLRPGPVHLCLPSDVAGQPAAAATGSGRTRDSAPAADPVPRSQITKAQQMIAQARRPAVLVGLGADPAAGPSLTALAHRLGAPVAVLPKAKGIVSEDDPCFLGVLEMAGQELVVSALADADLLITVGLDPVEMDLTWPFTAPVVHIDHLPNIDGYYPAELELTGPTAPLIDSLLAGEFPGGRWPSEVIQDHHSAVSDFIRPSRARLQPWQVIDAVRRAMPSDTIATCDVGAHKLLVGQAWTAFAPRTFFMANGLSSMGYAIPVAAAATIAAPGKPVVAFLGDGGLGMYLGELETLTRLGCDVLMVVFADNSLELIRRAQQRRGLPESGTSFTNPRFSELGQAFGIATAEVDSVQGLKAAIDTLADTGGVRLIAAHVDGSDYQL